MVQTESYRLSKRGETLRTYESVLAELETARKKWHEVSRTLSESKRDEMSANIQALMVELNAIATEGVTRKCECGAEPHGMMITPPIFKEDIMDRAPVFEVGCMAFGCEDRQSRGNTIPQAVEKWNESRYSAGRAKARAAAEEAKKAAGATNEDA